MMRPDIFEDIKSEYLELEPLDYKGLTALYKKHKDYLDSTSPQTESDREMYFDIISEIGITYAMAEEYKTSIPFLKRVIRLKKGDISREGYWLATNYMNLKKFVLGYYYIKVYGDKFIAKWKAEGLDDTKWHTVFLTVAKQQALKKINQYFNYSTIAVALLWFSVDFFEIEIPFLVRLCFWVYSLFVIFLGIRYYIRRFMYDLKQRKASGN